MDVPTPVSRRAFLAAAGTLPFVVPALAQRRTVPVGLELYSVRTELSADLLGTVSRVAAMGYQVVEFYSPYLTWTTEQAREVRKRLDDLGIRCPSTHNGANALSGDMLKKAIELNQIIGSRAVIIASPPRIVDVAGWKAFGGQLAAAADTLRPLGMSTGFHNHAVEWRAIEGQRPMDVLAAATPPDVTLQFDVGTCLEAGADPVAWIKANPGRIRSIHCKDWGAGEGRGYAVAFGDGDVPWRDVFAAAESVGGVEYYLIEQEVSPPGGQVPMAQKCLDNYRKLRS
jgi:sugar phosphate isomerase/epimerase